MIKYEEKKKKLNDYFVYMTQKTLEEIKRTMKSKRKKYRKEKERERETENES